jgi:hypothetical protein
LISHYGATAIMYIIYVYIRDVEIIYICIYRYLEV